MRGAVFPDESIDSDLIQTLEKLQTRVTDVSKQIRELQAGTYDEFFVQREIIGILARLSFLAIPPEYLDDEKRIPAQQSSGVWFQQFKNQVRANLDAQKTVFPFLNGASPE